ncbi:MAG: response regulator [Bdellovibrionales bacterium]
MCAGAKTKENYSVSYAQKPHVLVIDDDTRIRDLVVRYLCEHGFIVLSAEDAKVASEILEQFDVDIMVVDVMMPGETGTAFVQRLRDEGNEVPAIMLTALGEIEDRIEGLQAGADDYLPKPFEPKELVLRLHAILKRGIASKAKLYERFRIGPWEFNGQDSVLLGDDGEMVKLTSVEVNLIQALAGKAGQAVSRDDLASVCGLDAGERTIDVQVTRLRRKIEDDTKAPKYLQTVRGQGYLLRVDKP